MCSNDILDKNFNHSQAETRIYATWEKAGLFSPKPNDPGDSFVIVIPPPNVTGNLHMGHALDNTLQDILTRYHRMKGDNTLWLPGTDHAGIATQNVVERELAKENLSREALGREKFVERVWQWKREYGSNIVNQLRRLGASCDWSRERFTMDEGLSRAVREVFVRLYEEGLIYRGDYIINWCPRCLTALADIEVEHEERNQSLYYLNYLPENNLPPLVVATTRPETVFGDTAVAVNPTDPRFRNYIGQKVRVPLTDRLVSIIEDSYVDLEFGTGALKVTPAHDPNDFQIGRRHNLEAIKCLDESALLTAVAGHFAGRNSQEARADIVTELEEKGLLVKTEPLTHAVGVCYRCKTVVEPLLSRQWFVKTEPLAKEAIRAVRDSRTTFVPTMWEKTYFEWMENIRDWCISRQLWWGHQIPAWYCSSCNKTLVSRTDPDRCPDCGGALQRDPDVLDTWFSSGLWPFSTLGWPDNTAELKRYYPTTVLVTGFDIIFFWVARMMMMGLKVMGEVPFKTVAIHALVRDAQGQKMSKSKGNVIDPLTVIDKFGADAFRFTLAALAGQGRDIKLSTERVAGYSKFVNKLWNAAKFTLSNLEGDPGPAAPPTSIPDRWIRSRLAATISQCRLATEEFHFDHLADTLYHFIWDEFCDWYLELIKPILYGQDEIARNQTRAGLLSVLADILRLMHPIMPFVTEELWSKLPRRTGFIIKAPYPEARPNDTDSEAEAQISFLMDITRAIRQARADFGLPPGDKLSPVVKTEDPKLAAILSKYSPILLKLIGADSLTLAQPGQTKPREAALNALKWGEVWTPLGGHIDPVAESARLKKELGKLENDIRAARAKLGNPDYTNKAPEEIVEETRERLSATEAKFESVNRSLSLLSEMEL